DRIKKYSSMVIHIIYEQNSSIKKVEIEKTVDSIKNELNNGASVFQDFNISCVEATKDNIMLGLSDYSIGVSNDYFKYKTSDHRGAKNFEMLRMKIRLIMDLDTNQFYSRHNII
ncbi:MAG: hypothetical protein QM500_15785, partial [Methylococcales bacterium]